MSVLEKSEPASGPSAAMCSPFLRLPVAVVCAIALALALPSARACNVPVFRYALERWPADAFEVVVFHRGKLTDQPQAAMATLEKHSRSGAGQGNYDVRTVDLNADTDPGLRELWQSQSGATPPWIVALYPPHSRIAKPAWSGPLNDNSVAALLDSPMRRQVAQYLVKGDIAVWVLLESGDAQKDAAAEKRVQDTLKEVRKVLRLPPQIPAEYGMDHEAEAPSLRVAFSLLRLSRQDAQERAFAAMLLNTEDDLPTFTDPIVFPIFGRGRVLYALVGKGINDDTVGETCAFLAGPCSCQAKAMNPGVDLLMPVDWDAAIMGQLVGAADTPPLTGLPSLASPTATVTRQALPASKPTAQRAPSTLVRNALAAVAAGLAILAAATFSLSRTRRRG